MPLPTPTLLPRRCRPVLSSVAVLLLAAPLAVAQDGAKPQPRLTPPPPGQAAPAAAAAGLPGLPRIDGGPPTTRPMTPQVYDSLEQGFRITLPPGELQKTVEPDLLALDLNPQRNWRVEVRRLALETPAQLAGRELPEGGRQPGLVELVAGLAQQANNGELLGQGLTPLGSADAGTFALRYGSGVITLLQQVALIRADDTLYFKLTMTSPAPDGPAEAMGSDPGVRDAVAAFNDALNSFAKLDQSKILEDQEQRLDNTRSLFLNFTKKRQLDALVPEQWVRVRRDGKDVGYRYVVEEPAREVPGDPAKREGVSPLEAKGVRVGERTRLYTPAGRLDRETWLYADADMGREEFRERNVIRVEGKATASNVVVGSMLVRTIPRKMRVPRPGGLGTQDQVEIVDERKLEVNFAGAVIDKTETISRELPAWYVPQAVEHLMPRLVAQLGRNKYLMAVYAPDRKEVWQQYVDVEGPQGESVQGKRRDVWVVSTRLGLSGEVTRHFVDAGTYAWLGSVTADGVENWPTDAATLASIWSDANLTAPDARPTADE